MKSIPIERLHELFLLTESGELVRRIGRSGRNGQAGTVAGTLDSNGYVRVVVDGIRLRAHRAVFAMTHGRWPTDEVDHIDGNRANNRPANLRDVSRSVNGQNQRRSRRDNQSGLLGVSARPAGGWNAHIKTDGKRRRLGPFATPEAAYAAYVTEKRAVHAGCTI